MQPLQSLRINLGDLKAQIVKKIGAEKSKRYFYYLNRLFSHKMSKSEFDKLSYRVLGSENLPLHNQLIRYMFKNACHAKTPPPNSVSGRPKSAVQAPKIPTSRDDGHEQSSSSANQNHSVPIWSNGVLPVSPRRGRSGIRDRKLKDRPSSLGLNGKVECVSRPSMGTVVSDSKIALENGQLTPCDYKRPVQHLQAIAEQPKNEREGSVQRPIEKPRIHNKEKTEAAIFKDREDVEQANQLNFSTNPLLAPLGIPFCSASVGGARKIMPVASSGDFISYLDCGELSDNETLRKRLEQIAASQGLGGVSVDCANVLNNMLDVYLKQLIRSCVELVAARSCHEQPRKELLHKQQTQGKVINGIWPSNHLHMQNINGPLEVIHDHRAWCSISLLDFKVAMELNPQQLGEDWPLRLEKIYIPPNDE